MTMEAMSLELQRPRPRASRKPAARAPRPVRLDAVFDQVAAAALQERLRTLVTERSEITVEAADVERASTAGIQLLMAADAALARRGGRLALRDPSPALAEALRDLGLGAELERWSA